MHHQWMHLNMPMTNFILNTGTLTDASNFIDERFYIILMYDLFLLHLSYILYYI